MQDLQIGIVFPTLSLKAKTEDSWQDWV
jgi:hypothetical protein